MENKEKNIDPKEKVSKSDKEEILKDRKELILKEKIVRK